MQKDMLIDKFLPRYTFIKPFSGLIRKKMLKIIKQDSENGHMNR
jgi:hypothetical protein